MLWQYQHFSLLRIRHCNQTLLHIGGCSYSQMCCDSATEEVQLSLAAGIRICCEDSIAAQLHVQAEVLACL